MSNVSSKATESDIMDFFSFSGEIQHIELRRCVSLLVQSTVRSSLRHAEIPMKLFHNGIMEEIVWRVKKGSHIHVIVFGFCLRESEKSQVAFVTFKDPSALDTALLLSVRSLLIYRVLGLPARPMCLISLGKSRMECCFDRFLDGWWQGATIVDQSVNIDVAPVDEYVQPSENRSSDATVG